MARYFENRFLIASGCSQQVEMLEVFWVRLSILPIRSMMPKGLRFKITWIVRAEALCPNYSAREIKAFIQTYGLKARKLGSMRAKTIANLLSQQKIIGLFSGRMEFGPRSLGAFDNCDPRNAGMQRNESEN